MLVDRAVCVQETPARTAATIAWCSPQTIFQRSAARGQRATDPRRHLAQLLPPSYWVDKLAEAGLLRPGTVLLSGTIPMIEGVNSSPMVMG